MTPEQQAQLGELVNLIANAVAQKIGQTNKAPRPVVVTRTSDGVNPTKQEQTSLPQLIAELCDHMKVNNNLLSENSIGLAALINETKKQTSLTKKYFRQNE